MGKAKYLFYIAGILGFNSLMDFLLSYNILSFVALILISVGAGSFYLYKKETSITNIILLLFLTANVALYMCTRMTVSGLKDPLTLAFKLDAKSIALFASLMSIGYGIMQFGAGVLLTRFGIRYAAVSTMIYGILQLIMANSTSFAMILGLRVVLGISAASTVLGLCTFLTSVFPVSYFSMLFNLVIFIAYKSGAVINLIASNGLLNNSISWNDLLRYLGYGGLIIGSLIFILLFFMSKKSETVSEKVEENAQVTNEESGFKVFFTNIQLLLLGIYSWTSVVFMYIFQNGYFSNMIKTFSSNSPTEVGSYILNSSSAVYSLILPFTILMVGMEFNLLFAGICGLVGLTSILVFKSFWAIKLAAVCFAILGMSHNIPPLFVGENYGKSKNVNIYFGMMNFFAMFFGCSLSQTITGFVLQYIWKNNGSPMENGCPLYDGNCILTFMKYLSPFIFLSFAITVIIYLKRKKENSSN